MFKSLSMNVGERVLLNVDRISHNLFREDFLLWETEKNRSLKLAILLLSPFMVQSEKLQM